MKVISILDEDHAHLLSIKGSKSFAEIINDIIISYKILHKDEINKITVKNNTITETYIKANDVNNLIKLFEPINPAYTKMYANRTQREALRSLLRTYSAQDIESIIKLLPNVITRPYAPRITTPYELLMKFGSLMAYIKQESNKEDKKPIISIVS